MTEKKIKKTSLAGPLSLAALMFSVYVGPGFASGTQTVSYFMTKGWIGVFCGPLVVAILTFIVMYIELEFNRVYRPHNFRDQSDMIWGNKTIRAILGVYTEIVGMLQILLVTAAMVSGAANMFHTVWGIPMIAGTLIFAGAIAALTISGSQGVLKAGDFLTICILVVTVIIAVIGIGPTWPAAKAWIEQRVQPGEFGFSKLYAWYVIITFIGTFSSGKNAAIPASRKALHTRKDSLVASLGNAMMCFFATLVYTLIFAAGMPEITKEAIPTLYALTELIGASSVAQVLYVVIALAAMLSTGVGLMYGGIARYKYPLQQKFPKLGDKAARLAIVLAFIVGSTLLSKFGIIKIIGIGYTYMGVIGTPILFVRTIAIVVKMRKEHKTAAEPAVETEMAA